jgi:hypothetical protein
MEQAARALGGLQPLDGARGRALSATAPFVLTLEVGDPEVLAELRRIPKGGSRGA